MARGPKKHLKRVNAPKHWMLGKLDGIYAPKPSPGPHKMRECLPMVLILRNRLKYAVTGQEVKQICMQKHIKVDGKVRTDNTYPVGFMDVITIEKTGDAFRLLYDTKGRFQLQRVNEEEAAYKLCRVNKLYTSAKKVPAITTHDGRTIRYPDPKVKVNDSVKVDIATDKVVDVAKFDIGSMVTITKGNNAGRIGTITGIERHPGEFDIVAIKDASDNTFATRLQNVFVIGAAGKAWVTIPKGRGIKLSIIEERTVRESRSKNQ